MFGPCSPVPDRKEAPGTLKQQDKAYQKVLSNANNRLHFLLKYYMDESNVRHMDTITVPLDECMRWHTKQNRENRSAQGAHLWMQGPGGNITYG